MSTSERLYLYRDPAIDGVFRRRLERALGGLKVDCADGDVVDPDPDNPGVVMALASAAGGWALPARADIVVQAGPGDFPAGTQALRLETSDVEGETARWGRFLEKLRGTLGMASYSGESRNGKPHGFGVMAFNTGRDEGAYYWGAFDTGQRAGLGIGGTGDRLVWSGEWKDDAACGDGVLEAPDADGAPKPDRGWTWDARTAKRVKVHEPAPRTLPAPAK